MLLSKFFAGFKVVVFLSCIQAAIYNKLQKLAIIDMYLVFISFFLFLQEMKRRPTRRD